MANRDDDLGETLDAARNGRGADELRRLQARVRIIVGLAFAAGLFVDRIGPVLSREWVQYSDWGLGLMLAAILVLFGVEGLTALFARFLGK